ncbi:MAG: STAS domain-containing protein, partial [Candidatus Hydrogenedentes bacterium]|nr:STAS domain-containing protein [Candidatus Hydrogenedentota bacterium]
QLRQALLQAMSKAKTEVHLDLGQVAYMDSSGVATLVEGLKQSGKNGVRFAIMAPSQSVMKVLQLSKLDTVFDIRGAG